MLRTYYIRHGAMRHVGRFGAEGDLAFRRGERVVVRSRRGEELGEVLAEVESASPGTPRVLRVADADDLARARAVATERPRRLESCERFFQDGRWPLELIDVEPMLDEGRTVLLYLGPHKLDASGLAQALRDVCGLDAVFEPIGLDAQDEPEEHDHADDHGCGSCGSGGGCGSSGGGCGTGSGGCDGCAVKNLVGSRKAVALT
jgi:cell fate regulator YaaT (PSP1 superfamily)